MRNNKAAFGRAGIECDGHGSSTVGLSKARQLANERKMDVEFQLAELKLYDWDAAQYDVVPQS